MNGILLPLCPALPVMTYQPSRVSPATLTPRAVDHLEENPSVVVSGRSHDWWDLNKQIYKTRTVKNRLIPKLRREGLTVSYLDIQKLIQRRNLWNQYYYKFEPLLKKAREMRAADVYVLDEIQHALPFRDGSRRYGIRGNLYGRATIAFWSVVAAHLERGGRIVYVTAVHPLDPNYKGVMFDSAVASFFTAPILELGLNS